MHFPGSPNSSVAGYAVEGVVLNFISSRGLDLGVTGRYLLMESRGFSGTTVISTLRYETILHLPEAFNFPAVDGLIVSTSTQMPLNSSAKRVCRPSGIQVSHFKKIQ